MSQPLPHHILNRLLGALSVQRGQRIRRCTEILLLLVTALLLLVGTSLAAAAGQTTIIYPELVGPYKDVFETIVSGITANTDSTIHRYPLPKDYQLQKLRQALQESHTEGIISLGKRGYFAVKQLKTEIPTVVGALSMVPNGSSGVSLSADPDKLFGNLKSLVPTCKRVFVVYSEKNSGWLIPLARRAAEKYNLQLMTYPAKDLREAMHHYRSILEESHSNTDAIWLPLDRVTVNDDVVLPMLLQKAWDKNLAIISNKPSHAKRGVLFAIYPDNQGLGQELAALLERLTTTGQGPTVIPLKRLLLAVNLRTAAHLGLSFTRSQQEGFTLTFPSR